MTSRRFLLMMSGSIACAKASGLISAWVKQGHAVQVACTASVGQFIGNATLEGLSGRPVFGDAFASGQVMDHVDLARWADVVVACPATANLVNKLAAGIADDAVGSLWQACWGRGAPMFVVPAMNHHMWRYPATQAALETLRGWGVHVLPTATGDLACGERGEGRMLECADILSHIHSLLDVERTRRPRRILVTGGGTREPLDAVRFIGNHSTGRTSASLCDALARAGHEVTWLGARHAQRPGPGVRIETFGSFAELDAQLQSILGGEDYDMVVHAAAVSDFSVAAVGAAVAKLPSDTGLSLQLTPNPKLLDRLRDYSRNPRLRVVGFKLTVGSSEAEAQAAVARLFRRAGVDAVVHNDLAAIRLGRHSFDWHCADGQSRRYEDSAALARGIAALAERDA